MSFILIFILPAMIWSSAFAGCPNQIRQRDWLTTCSIQESYGDGFTFSDNCYLLHTTNCTFFKLEKWNNPAIPYCQTSECGLHLSVFVSDDTFPRNRLNLTISNPLRGPLWIMYENSTIPDDAKCFTLEANNLKSECNSSITLHSKNTVHSIICPLASSDSYSTVKIVMYGRKMQYSFRNLYNKSLLDGVIFFYNSMLQSQNMPISITFQSRPDILDYTVKLFSKEQNKSIKTFSVNLLDNTTYAERFADLVTLTFSDGLLKNGAYEVSVECQEKASFQLCCNRSKTFEFNIQEQYGTSEIATSIILVFLTLGFILVILTLYLRREALKPLPNTLKLLLVHDSVSVQHTAYVKATQIFLRKSLGIQVLLDVIDIPQTQSKKPFQWLESAISRVNYVAFIVPSKPGDHSGSPYQNLYDLGLNLMESDIEKGLKTRTNSPTKYIYLVLPDSDKERIPEFSHFAAHFRIPFDYFCLRQHIHSTWTTCIRLPRWILFNETTYNRKFFEIFEDVQNSSEKLPVLDNKCNVPLIKKGERTSFQTEELNNAFGNQIKSVKQLPAVVNPEV